MKKFNQYYSLKANCAKSTENLSGTQHQCFEPFNRMDHRCNLQFVHERMKVSFQRFLENTRKAWRSKQTRLKEQKKKRDRAAEQKGN